MPTVRNRLQRAKASHLGIAVTVGLAFALVAVLLDVNKYMTQPVFGVVASTILLAGAFLAPLLVTLKFSPQKDNDHEHS